MYVPVLTWIINAGGDFMFKNDTPSDILDIPVDEVYKFVEDPPGYSGPSPRVRLNFVKMLYDVLGYQLTPLSLIHI